MDEHAEAASQRRGNMFVEILKYTLIAFIIVMPIRIFVAQPFIVSGESMIPTFDPKEYLVVDQLTYRFEEPQRGDVLIFKYPLDTSEYFIKRLVALPGEEIRIEGGVVSIRVPGSEEFIRISEPYVAYPEPEMEKTQILLQDDEFFVLGDNRNESSDSRVWGPLKERYIVGRALLRILPLNEADVLPGKHRYSDL